MPKYLGQKWLDSNTPEVGKLSINRKGGRVEVTFKLNEHLAKSGDPSPIDHNLMLSGKFCLSEVFKLLNMFSSPIKIRNTGSPVPGQGRFGEGGAKGWRFATFEKTVYSFFTKVQSSKALFADRVAWMPLITIWKGAVFERLNALIEKLCFLGRMRCLIRSGLFSF